MIDLREGAGRILILQGGLLLTMIKHRRPRAVSKVAPITHISLYLHIPAKGTRVGCSKPCKQSYWCRLAITMDARGEAWQQNIDDLLDVP